MPLHPTWTDIAVRLVLAVLAGAAAGFNREERGQAAGLRTTVLICAGAALAMALANLLLATGGKEQASFAQIDVLRLPLGVLSGIGFIGAGAIVRRDDIVRGVATAATLWFMTIVGLCIGAGHLGLGLAAAVCAVAVLWGAKQLELRLSRKISALLSVRAERERLSEDALRDLVRKRRFEITGWSIAYERGGAEYQADIELRWSGRLAERAESPPILGDLLRAGAVTANWRPTAV